MLRLFVCDNAALVWNNYFYYRIVIVNDALTTQPRLQTRISSTVDKVFLLIRNLLEMMVAFIDVNVTGTTRAHAAAVVTDIDII